MNLERLLAENMVRFGTRNLTEHQVKRILKEQIAAVKDSKFKNTVVEDFVNSPVNWPEPFKTAANGTLNFLRNNKISFTNVSMEKAAAAITLYENVTGNADISKINKSKNLNDVLSVIQSFDTAVSLPATTIQLNESPDKKGMVLTNGVVRPDGVAAADPGAASSIDDIVTFCNNYNIAVIIQALNGVTNLDVIGIIPYELIRGQIGTTGNTGLRGVTSGGSFIPGDPSKTPGAGSLDLNSALSGASNVYYSKNKYTAASGQSTGLTLVTVDPVPGPEVPFELPKESFPILKIQLTQTGIDAIKECVEAAKQQGQIQNVRIESAASFDERVLKNNADFAAAVGLRPDQVPTDPTRDVQGVVKDPMYGGNSFLAYMRGQAIAKQLEGLINVTPTMVAEVKTGKDKARYAKLKFEVKKPDGTITFTADELRSIGQGSKNDSGEGRFQIFKFGS